MKAGSRLAFDLVAIVDGPVTKRYYRFKCASCAGTLDFPPGKLSSEAACNKAKLAGWEAHPTKRNRIFCPNCVTRRETNDVDSELKDITPMAVTPMIKTTSPDPTPAIAALRQPTNDQRAKIRTLLDTHFDDSKGCYLDSMTDQKIAELAGVPRKIVEDLRELAYSPLRYDPVIAGLQDEINALKRDLANSGKVVENYKTRLDDLAARVDRLQIIP
jgi:hypothetical protein